MVYYYWTIVLFLLLLQTILGKATLPLESIELCDVDEVWSGTPPLILLHKSDHYPTNYPEPLLTSTSRPLPLGTFHKPRTSTEIQTDDTLPYRGKGGADFEVVHVGRTPNFSEVLDDCLFCIFPRFWDSWGTWYVIRVGSNFLSGVVETATDNRITLEMIARDHPSHRKKHSRRT